MHDAFLHDLCDHPDDDAPRLVYADWLDDQGDAERAEFIRAQCELAKMSVEDERRPELEARETQLLAGHHNTWARPVGAWVRHYVFRRGFVEGVELSGNDFLNRADELFALAPVRHLKLVHVAARAADLAACPHLGRLSALEFADPAFGTHVLRTNWAHRLGRRPAAVPASERVLTELLRSPHLARLRALGLAGNGIGSSGARLLARAPLEALTELDLRHNDLTGEDLDLLAGAPALARLRVLRLREGLGLGGSQGSPPRFIEGATRILERLEALELTWATTPPAGPFSPGAAPALHALRLDQVTPDVAALAASPVLPRLTVLALDRCGPLSLRSLVSGPAFAGLRALSLRAAGLHRPALERLASSPHLARLARLGLADNGIGDVALAILVGADLTGLAELDLAGNDFTVTGLQALLASPLAAGLRRLDLRDNALHDTAVGALLRADLPRLAWLDLRGNPLSAAGRQALRARFGHAVRYGPSPRRGAPEGTVTANSIL